MAKLSIQEERDEERIRRRKKALEKVRDIKPDVAQASEEDGNAGTAHGMKRGVSMEEEDDEEGDYDDQEYYEEEDYDEEHDIKRQRTEEAVEFNEEDIAWQLGAMAQDYGLDEEDMDGGEDMSLQDASVIFKVFFLGCVSFYFADCKRKCWMNTASILIVHGRTRCPR